MPLGAKSEAPSRSMPAKSGAKTKRSNTGGGFGGGGVNASRHGGGGRRRRPRRRRRRRWRSAEEAVRMGGGGSEAALAEDVRQAGSAWEERSASVRQRCVEGRRAKDRRRTKSPRPPSRFNPGIPKRRTWLRWKRPATRRTPSISTCASSTPRAPRSTSTARSSSSSTRCPP